jgi:hypothetical protein
MISTQIEILRDLTGNNETVQGVAEDAAADLLKLALIGDETGDDAVAQFVMELANEINGELSLAKERLNITW